MSHRTRIVEIGDQWQAVCTCERTSWRSPHKWQAEDWIRLHLEQVEKAKARSPRTPSLQQSRAWFRKQADDPANPEKDRRYWRALADELDARINDSAADDDTQPGLW